MKKQLIFTLLLCVPLIGLSQEENQENKTTQESNNSWNFNVTPYFYAAGMEGEISFLNQSIPLDASFSDLAENLSFGAMLNAEASKGKWTIMTDVIYIKLKKDGELLNGNITTKAELEQIIFELGGGYTFAETGIFKMDAIVGARFFNLDTSFTIQELSLIDKTISFTDPYIGVRYRTNLKKWRHSGRIDIGGFGAGSEYSWKFNLLVGYDVSKTIALIVGYQGYGVDYKEDDISFQYDIFTGGGVFAINFNF